MYTTNFYCFGFLVLYASYYLWLHRKKRILYFANISEVNVIDRLATGRQGDQKLLGRVLDLSACPACKFAS